MAEETKGIRLKKAATELNVGITTLVDYLAKKGHQVETNPNARLTPEQYELVAAQFASEREVKEQADKIEISTESNVVVEATSEETAEEQKEVIIKNYNAPIETVVAKPSSDTVEIPNETSDVPQVEDKTAIEEAPAEEKKEVAEFVPTQVGDLRIVNKIDLDAINAKTRPDKKKKSEKKEKAEKKDEKKEVKKEQKEVKEEKKGKKQEEKPVEPKTPVELVNPSETNPETPALDEKDVAPAVSIPEKIEDTEPSEPSTPPAKPEPEFIETKYQKLEGPKLVGKIDLSQIKETKPVSGEKKKRKRIKNKGVKVDEVAAAVAATTASKQPKATKQQSGTDSKSEKKKKKEKEKKVAKVEIDDNEIEKQIRDTLARLNPMGKSKTSKHNREKRQKVHQRMEEEQIMEMEQQKVLQVTEFVTANELATMMNVPITQIISTCMSVGIFVSINQRLDAETIKLIADEFGFEINFASADVVDELNRIEEEDRPEDLITRNPIITVMGHVDHGKTSLLDYIRKTNVIAGEAGGITQHIGAYEVTTSEGRKITFLDTPGHEAFTAMRARGAKVTDIAIIVIAADDKIMPQTVEAINHAQAAGVPIVFAINKIDKPGADPDRIKTELANMNLLIEEWGGKYQSQDISAKKGIGVEELLEKVLLQADIMELKGNPKKRAKGTVLESSLDKGRGYVAKLLVENGTIRKGDPIVAGAISGRVRAMYNERNQEVMSAGPSQPVLLLGLTGACQAGDTFNVTENEKEAKEIAAKRTQLQREMGLRTQTHLTLDEIGRRIALGNFKELNIIVKGDVDGSVEALSDSLLKLSTDEVQVNVIHKAVGQITETDVMLAESSDAIIIGFQVRPSVGARKMAETEKIDIRLYSIIYDAINELKDAIEGMLAPETQEKIVANLEIRETFKISKVGTIAGCMCLDGKITRSHNVRIIRDGIVVYTGKLASLKRFKDDVKEVVSGQDCGLNIEGFNDIKVGDIVEAYEVIEIKRKL